MTSNDRQIDLLMRRYAKAAPRRSVSDHLDADELSAFAEGALPQATRARYVSHLAECDECRKQASDLAISSGAMISAEQTQPNTSEGRSFWQVLAGMFALPVLRYAAFGAVVLIVAGVAFVALRRTTESPMIAMNDRANQQHETAVKPPVVTDAGPSRGASASTATSGASPSRLAPDSNNSKTDEPRVAGILPASPAPSPMKEGPLSAMAEKKAGDIEVAKAAPSYAPPPPNESITLSQQQQNAARDQQYSTASGPRQQQQKLETLDKVQERERDAGKDVSRSDDMARKSAPLSVGSSNQSASRRAADEKAKGPMRNMDNNAMNRNDAPGRAEAPKKSGEDRPSTEEAQTRSVGGRKFRRQGNAWVDQKFKSSMTLKSIARGSNEFADLDSGLRSIVQQLGGEVIVVWKDKAYLIK